jgi:hypothetical protein
VEEKSVELDCKQVTGIGRARSGREAGKGNKEETVVEEQ